jgi:hypothetical protein
MKVAAHAALLMSVSEFPADDVKLCRAVSDVELQMMVHGKFYLNWFEVEADISGLPARGHAVSCIQIMHQTGPQGW